MKYLLRLESQVDVLTLKTRSTQLTLMCCVRDLHEQHECGCDCCVAGTLGESPASGSASASGRQSPVPVVVVARALLAYPSLLFPLGHRKPAGVGNEPV